MYNKFAAKTSTSHPNSPERAQYTSKGQSPLCVSKRNGMLAQYGLKELPQLHNIENIDFTKNMLTESIFSMCLSG